MQAFVDAEPDAAAALLPGFAARELPTRGAPCRRIGLGAEPGRYGDVLAIWRAWAPDVRGTGLDASHFLAEDRPDETAARLVSFLAGD